MYVLVWVDMYISLSVHMCVYRCNCVCVFMCVHSTPPHKLHSADESLFKTCSSGALGYIVFMSVCACLGLSFAHAAVICIHVQNLYVNA